MDVPSQRAWKRSHVVEVLAKIGDITDVEIQPVIGTDHHFGYRTKLTPHYDAPNEQVGGSLALQVLP